MTRQEARTAMTRSVLVAEDNLEALSGISALLSGAGFAVQTALNGAEALDLLEDGFRPDVVVLDLMMPKVSGWEILKHLQTDAQLRHIPVLVMTALDRDEARVVGADVVLQKPVQPTALVAAVRRLADAAS